MNRALLQHAEDKVDRDQRREDQDWSAAKRTLERARFPGKLVAIEGGMWRSAAAFCTADTAAPMVLFGARLKLSVTDGNWPW
jgi:hypothetical protein